MMSIFPPIVMLHHVSDDPIYGSLKPYSISKKTFIQLLDFVQNNNYRTITFAQAAADKDLLRTSGNIILTFDDCSKSLLDFAVPELIDRKLKSVFYMPTAHIGSYNLWDVEQGKQKVELMNENDLKELNTLGMEVGAHSHHHIKLKEVKDKKKIAEEVSLSKKIIEGITGQTVYSFCYPFGSVPYGYKETLTYAGYRFATSIYQPFQNNLALRRFIYHDGDTQKTLQQKFSPLYKWYRTILDPLRSYKQ